LNRLSTLIFHGCASRTSDGCRVAAETNMGLLGGSILHVVDVLHIEDGLIRMLNYFTTGEPTDLNNKSRRV